MNSVLDTIKRLSTVKALAVIVIGAAPVFAYVPYWFYEGNKHDLAFASWLWTSGAILAGLVLLGLGGKQRDPFGVLIDDNRNRYSLSRLQLVGWTALIFGALMAAVVANLKTSGVSPSTAFDIELHRELWALLGISTASLVGSSLIKKAKFEAKDPNDDTRSALHTADEPHLEDLVQGEGRDNAGQIDLGKVQMLILTAVALFAYAVILAEMFNTGTARPEGELRPFIEFPALSGTLIVILLISHGGYLVQKQVTTPANA